MLGMYKHYKGGLYTLLNIAVHTETKESLAIYVDVRGNVWARPLPMFLEEVEVDGNMVKRFEKI